ncbi:MAG: TIGR01244 family sulfur transferase [Pseudomonadota bacterium]
MSANFKAINDHFWASPQLTVADVALAADKGVKLIINNRPDDEEPGQPSNAVLEDAAHAAGLAYVHIPVTAGLNLEQVQAFIDAIENAGGGLALGFCRSGMRSTMIWAFASAAAGRPGAQIAAEAAQAGFDMSGQIASLDALRAAQEEDE